MKPSFAPILLATVGCLGPNAAAGPAGSLAGSRPNISLSSPTTKGMATFPPTGIRSYKHPIWIVCGPRVPASRTFTSVQHVPLRVALSLLAATNSRTALPIRSLSANASRSTPRRCPKCCNRPAIRPASSENGTWATKRPTSRTAAGLMRCLSTAGVASDRSIPARVATPLATPISTQRFCTMGSSSEQMANRAGKRKPIIRKLTATKTRPRVCG